MVNVYNRALILLPEVEAVLAETGAGVTTRTGRTCPIIRARPTSRFPGRRDCDHGKPSEGLST